jgi:hypothetical protein
VHKDLLAFQAKTEHKHKFEQIDGRLDKLDQGLRGLRADMPKIVSSAMREVLGRKSRKYKSPCGPAETDFIPPTSSSRIPPAPSKTPA